MKVLYDHQCFNQRYGGIPRYHLELMKGLKDEGNDYYLSLLFNQYEHLVTDNNIKVVNPIGNNQFKGRHKIIQTLTYINKKYSEYNIKNKEYDIFHPTYYNPYFLKNLKKPFVITIHDFVHEKFTSERKADKIDSINKQILIEKADKIIAISENTKKDIIQYYSISEDKISVIYHGYNKINFNIEKNNKQNNYILYIGKRDGYKNFNRFINAVSILLRENIPLNLICTGNPFTSSEIELFKKLNIAKQVFHVAANEVVLNLLYKNALLFIYPSLYEGFGMPILEAFSNNCPICISNTSCFPEIAQDAAIYFNPYDEHSIYNAIKVGISDNQVRNEIIKLGNKRLLDFSWNKTTFETIEVYKQLL